MFVCSLFFDCTWLCDVQRKLPVMTKQRAVPASSSISPLLSYAVCLNGRFNSVNKIIAGLCNTEVMCLDESTVCIGINCTAYVFIAPVNENPMINTTRLRLRTVNGQFS